jgi:hypothetical protein
MLCKWRENVKVVDRLMITRAIDIWIAKELIWYVVVVITFLNILIDQDSNALIYQIVAGVITFVILFWWRTT